MFNNDRKKVLSLLKTIYWWHTILLKQQKFPYSVKMENNVYKIKKCFVCTYSNSLDSGNGFIMYKMTHFHEKKSLNV